MTPTPSAPFDWSSFAPERVVYWSDLHLEHHGFEPPADLDADLIILAGDIHTKGRAAAWAKTLNRPCVLVLGNHDHYGETLGGAYDHCVKAAEGSLVATLANQSLQLANLRILGSTLWTDYRLAGNPPASMRAAENNLRDPYASGMTDHRKIRTRAYSKARASDFAREHFAARRFLEAQLDIPCETPTLIASHHAPSPLSLPTHPAGQPRDLFDACYASDLEPLFGADRFQAWIHGHIHRQSRYELHGGVVLCNPRGYPGEKLTGFDPKALLLVSELAARRDAALAAAPSHPARPPAP